ncbi:hypothetical protein ABW19_dt0207163 [Dactylella cylindrospora]|nr:hypothetical protein ABW19_dt0207163 [Dactylella cylindrospora]
MASHSNEMDSDTDENETFSVIDFYDYQNIINDNAVEYFDWGDDKDDQDDSTVDTQLAFQPNEFAIPSDITESTETPPPPPAPTIPSVVEHFVESLEGDGSSERLSSLLETPTTPPSVEIPQVGLEPEHHDGNVADTLSNLDISNQMHLAFIEACSNDVVKITWKETNNLTKPPSYVREKIEEVFTAWLSIINGKGGQMIVRLRGHERRMLMARNDPKWIWRTLVYPGHTHKEIQRFAAFVRILELINEAIKLDVVYTKRDVYYKDVALFRSQQLVNNLVDDIAVALGVPRRTLHITAAAKGLICGDVRIYKTDDTIINCCMEGEGVLVPASNDIKKLRVGECKSVIIIEKEVSDTLLCQWVSTLTIHPRKAIFRTLAESGEWKKLPGRPILLCGKGYPDIATREIAHLLYVTKNIDDEYLDFYCLVDYDPHGLDIFTMYKNGSLLSGVRGTNYMSVPSLKHLGIKFRDILNYCSEEKDAMSQGVAETQNREEEGRKRARTRLFGVASAPGLLVMTRHDRAKATGMLERGETEYSDDLKNLLFVGYKAEIQILGDKLSRYLDEKLGGSA